MKVRKKLKMKERKSNQSRKGGRENRHNEFSFRKVDRSGQMKDLQEIFGEFVS